MEVPGKGHEIANAQRGLNSKRNARTQWACPMENLSVTQEKNINLASPSLPLHKYPMLKEGRVMFAIPRSRKGDLRTQPQTVFQILREEPAILKQFRTQYPWGLTRWWNAAKLEWIHKVFKNLKNGKTTGGRLVIRPELGKNGLREKSYGNCGIRARK